MVGAGCESSHSHTYAHAWNDVPSAVSAAPNREPEVTYTVEMIPNPRLSATSREGDDSGAVYSSNIVAVYVHHRGESTNSNVTDGQSIQK